MGIVIDRTDGLASSSAMKGPVRCATTTNITLSGLQVIDGISVQEDDRVLVKDQTDARANGIYVVSIGLWRRSADFNNTRDVRKGTMIIVTDGIINSGEWYVSTENPVAIGISEVTFARVLTFGLAPGEVMAAVVFETKAQADANLNYPALTAAWVVDDDDPNNNGIYQKQGGSGSGSWLKLGDFPRSWTPLYRNVSRGQDRVQEIYDWTGGWGAKPPTGYIGPVGLTQDIDEATNIRGIPGPNGSGTGDMLKATYDPEDVEQDIFASLHPSVKWSGAQSGGSAGSLIAAFQTAIDALPANGGYLNVPPGDYSNLDPSQLSVGNKAITFVATEGVTLPPNMPGVVLATGIFSLPESSLQANRNVRVNNFWDAGNKIPGVKQYAHHVHANVETNTGGGDYEFRAYSFDITTNKTLAEVNTIYGVKGRVAGNGGSSNMRGLYGFAEGINGSGFTGLLTGVLGTVYANDTNVAEAIAVRGHVDAGSTAAFQAAGAKTNEANTPSFGYSVRTGTGGPLLPQVACYQAHGGGAGDMFLGYKSHTEVTNNDRIYRVTKEANLKHQGSFSGTANIADDGVITITPPSVSGFLFVDVEQVGTSFALSRYRSASTALNAAIGSPGTNTTLLTATVLTGTTGTDGNLNISVVSSGGNGTIYLENRTGASRQVTWEFKCTRVLGVS